MSNASEIHADSFVVTTSRSPHATYLRVRWLFEVIIILASLPVLLPLCALISLVVIIDTGMPILYFQDRPGKNGKLFRIAKFRTMVFQKNELDKITVDNDPRITKYGVFLRHHRLDELPQFWNVLRGDMSIIGPRPEPYYSAKEFSRTVPYYTERYSIAPGITGWQQVNQG
ncbi:MAG: sugar transferase, partial [Candidatus Kapaibacterium sp.]